MPQIDTRSAVPASLAEAFSLLELLIVILLLSLFAFLAIGYLKQESTGKHPTGLSALYALPQQRGLPPGELICTDRCRECLYRQENRRDRPLSLNLPPVTAYAVDASDRLRRLDFGRFRDREICLRFRYYPNGSHSRMVLEGPRATYYFPSYFGPPRRFSSPEEAARYWLRDRDRLRDRGDYY